MGKDYNRKGLQEEAAAEKLIIPQEANDLGVCLRCQSERPFFKAK
jgi:hypothetical protein